MMRTVMTMIFTSVIVCSSIQKSGQALILTRCRKRVNPPICKELLIHINGNTSIKMGGVESC